MEDILLQSVRDRVATLTLNRPGSRNALSTELRDALLKALQACADDPAVGAIVLTGAGTAFCAGGDVKRMAEGEVMTREDRLASLQLAHRIPALLASLPKIVIAAINGAANGAGLALACACDFRIAATSARFGTSFVKVGLASDFGASWTLTQLVGAAKARELLLMGEPLDATEAQRIGLVTRVVDTASLMDAAHAMALHFANGPTVAQALLKKNLAGATTMTFQQSLDLEALHQAEALYTADHHEAVNAFLQKRAPVFLGR